MVFVNKVQLNMPHIQDAFNNHLDNIGPRFADKKATNSYIDYMPNHLPNSLDMEQITCAEITNTIKKIKIKLSTGFYNISTQLTNNYIDSIALLMAEIFNSTIRSNIWLNNC